MENKVFASLEPLLLEMLNLTNQLEESVLQEDGDPDEWVRILESRENIIEQISQLQNQGARITDEQKQRYLLPIQESNRKLIPLISAQKNEVQKRLHKINQSKILTQQYMGGNGYTPYGAFFDKKK